ncbi:MAG TPA: nucleotide sugar dehydrogenase [Candidatus Eisenbacteria bacterium]|nr:nucleotide sugar dehydrogenase [Candidatus Eisenbacteria bacterium]
MLIEKLKDRSAHLGVVGLGYVGLPLAMEYARAGFRVTGFDVVAGTVESLNQGRSHVRDVPSGILQEAVASGRFRATTDFSELAGMDTVNICVPTPLRKTKDPDVSYIVAAVEEIAKYLHKDMLVILESTTYPGTTEELILPMLEATGLKVGEDFFLGFSPERVDPGNATYNTHNIPKVVGGVTPACTETATHLYRATLDTVIPVSSTRVAEMVKLLENTFRSVNIGLVNELALMCDSMGIDVWEVIDAAATKPFGFMPFYPGPGLGGHCIPIDPFYLSWKAREVGFEARFIELAGMVNSYMPQHVVQKCVEVLNERGKPVRGSRILILGVAYKSDIEDVRESPAIGVIERLLRLDGDVDYHDPYVADLEREGLALKSVLLTPDRIAGSDLIVIVTPHKSFDYDMVLEHAQAVFDTRNALKGRNSAKIRRL